MENMPPSKYLPRSRRLSHTTPTMRQTSKSSPVKRAALAPHSANDVFSADTGLLTPQSNGSEAEKSLISPPPEEDGQLTTRSQSASKVRAGSEPVASRGSFPKRKRTNLASVANIDEEDTDQSQSLHAADATPNPRARKQKRIARVEIASDDEQDSSSLHARRNTPVPSTSRSQRSPAPSPSKTHLMKSPHSPNPAADYIPAIPTLTRAHLSSRARSSTPIPVYEPPTERFTPPREVVLASPAAQARSSARKSRVSRLKLVVKVKAEPPEIDLSKPAPPPSPTDDPLLLRGHARRAKLTPSIASSTPPQASGSRLSRGRKFSFSRTAAAHPSSSASPAPPFANDGTLPPSSPEDATPVPVFDFNNVNAGDGWSVSDSDGDDGDGEGEYTGRFRMTSVPTKMDPPTSRTRERSERWGRPISPFPLKVKGKGRATIVEEDEEEDEERELPMPSDDDYMRGQEAREVEAEHGQERADEQAMEDVEHTPPPPDPPVPVDHHEETAAIDAQNNARDDAEPPATQEERQPSPSVPVHGTHVASPELSPSTLRGRTRRLSELSDDGNDEDTQRAHRRLRRHASDSDSGFMDGSTVFGSQQVQPAVGEPIIEETQAIVEEEERAVAVEEQKTREKSVAREVDEQVTQRVRSLSPLRAKSVEEYEEYEDEEVVDRQLSVEPQPGPSKLKTRQPVEVVDDDEEMDDAAAEVEPEASDSEGEGDSSNETDLSVVKVVSDDPWAAARAAAILKQHGDWDLVPKIVRRRPSSVHSILRHARRADLSGAGIRKSSPAPAPRRALGVVVDGRVIMPGTPSMTLPELLHEAESDVTGDHESVRSTPMRSFASGSRQQFRTPSPFHHRPASSGSDVVIDMDGPRSWTKDDWKILDACFTDARLEVGERLGEGVLGHVDLVELDDVVDRFVELMGGVDVIIGLGESWTREDLLKRARAIQKKQQSGVVAPPTPSLRASSVSSTTPTVPDFTPVHAARRQGLLSVPQPRLSAPAFADTSSDKTKLPPTLMAPRYSHLMAEAVSVSRHDVSKTPSTIGEQLTDSDVSFSTTGRLPTWGSESPAPPSPSVGSRMKGFFFSYLPTLKSKSKPKPKTYEPAQPGFPLPPPEILEKPRGPVTTPAPKPLPKPAHPKELVNLQHAPPLESKIPTLQTQKNPRRLVDLRAVTPVPEKTLPVRVPDGRRDSGGSVKDLVSSFEDRSREIEKAALALRRKKSVGRLAGVGGTAAGPSKSAKPIWR